MINVNRHTTLGATLFLSLTICAGAHALPPPCEINGQVCSLDVCAAVMASVTCSPQARECHSYCGQAGAPKNDVPPVLQNTLTGLRSLKMIKPGADVDAVTEMLRQLKREIDSGKIKPSPVTGSGFVTFFWWGGGQLKLKEILPYGEKKDQPPIHVEADIIVVMYNVSPLDASILRQTSADNIQALVKTVSDTIGDPGK